MPWISPTYKFDVIMLGNTGVGKTSLLASMYEQLTNSINDHIEITIPDMKTGHLLGESLQELKCMYYTDGLIPWSGIAGTQDPRTFLFDIKQKSQEKPAFSLRIHDYPGIYCSSKASDEQRQYLENLLKDAILVFVVIDMPALMEEDGRYNSIRNSSFAIQEFLCNKVSKSGVFPIIFTGLRGEKYIREGRLNEALNKILVNHERLIRMVQNLSELELVYGCFPQTTGSIIFDKFIMQKNDEGKNVPVYTFKKISENARYQPQDCDLPLRLLVAWATVRSFSLRRQYWDGFNWLRDVFDRDAESIKASQELFAQLENRNLFYWTR